MAKNYPTIGEYNQLIQKKGGNAFRSLYDIRLIPSRTTPIKVYLFGSGAFAAVFKGSLHGTNYAIRCFLTAEDETISRYKTICDYLNDIQVSWKFLPYFKNGMVKWLINKSVCIKSFI